MRGQSGRGADDPRERITARTAATQAAVELVRELVAHRREVTRTPLRTLAAEIGITRSALDRFHKVRSRPGKNWPKLRDWYMAKHKTPVDAYETPPELLVAMVLRSIETVPGSQRASALRATAEHYRILHAGTALPKWVQMLGDLADTDNGAAS